MKVGCRSRRVLFELNREERLDLESLSLQGSKKGLTRSGSENMSREGALAAVDGPVGEGGSFDGDDAVDRGRGLRMGDASEKMEGRGTIVEAAI